MTPQEKILSECNKWYHKNNGEVTTTECFRFAIEEERQRITEGINKLESLTNPNTGDMNYETEHKGEWVNKSEVLALLEEKK